MSALRFWKTQAIGNDFVLVHLSDLPANLDLSFLALKLCDRKRGIGADGLLVVSPGNLRMFNPDGSEDFCGNGLRCAVVHGFHHGLIGSFDSLHHLDRDVQTWITGENRAKVELPPASFLPVRVPHHLEAELFMSPMIIGDSEQIVSSLSTGSTHTVILADAPISDSEFLRIGTLMEHHAAFPQRTSTMFAYPVSDRELVMRPFERGAGETLGCGTGSAATAVVWARKTGLTGEFVIRNTGGAVSVHLEAWNAPIQLESDVVEVYTGTYAIGEATAVKSH
jgi:diaminopimelate epimerase